ncbi:DUF4139 domain-containing protein [Jannaschia sp. W003]|uniref:DUF4139 domain-containing protein n=1 Tax=Jannaschia sp. W003 TaxID=2867012 RepID=UPI0021A90E86|nr:DUF4139 domain-containing protein [Jannaschia sp. W003]UWQ22172.1 DUF4139 domain-containing protein [Jannaschia sp. W003]
MRLALVALLLPLPALADDIPLRADVVAATVYLAGADTVRRAEAEVPAAGEHRLLVPLADAPVQPLARTSMPVPSFELPRATLEGAELLGAALLDDAGLDLEALDTPAQGEARRALRAAEEVVRETRAAVERARGALAGAAIRTRWLDTLAGGGEGTLRPPADPAALGPALGALAAASGDAAADRVAAAAAVEAAERALEEAEAREAEARRALERLRPLAEGTPVLAISLVADAAGPVRLTLDGRTDAARWQPRYEARLDTGAEAVRLDRRAELRQDTGEIWRDVALRLSTEDPFARAEPTPPMPDPARARPPAPPPVAEARAMPEAMDAPLEMDVAALGTARAMAPEVVFEGATVRLEYPRPVTVRPGAPLTLALGTVELPAETELRAVPRRDATAFLVAEARNAGAEPIPSGPAVLVRDGARVGETFLAALAPGAEVELGFGAVETVRLRWLPLARGEGDAGVFRRSDTLRERLAFEVENTGAAAREVLALHALPFSEQEDVGVEVDARPAPDLRDWRDLRGVAGWRMALAPGETRRVEIAVEIDWPEGQELHWRP